MKMILCISKPDKYRGWIIRLGLIRRISIRHVRVSSFADKGEYPKEWRHKFIKIQSKGHPVCGYRYITKYYMLEYWKN